MVSRVSLGCKDRFSWEGYIRFRARVGTVDERVRATIMIHRSAPDKFIWGLWSWRVSKRCVGGVGYSGLSS